MNVSPEGNRSPELVLSQAARAILVTARVGDPTPEVGGTELDVEPGFGTFVAGESPPPPGLHLAYARDLSPGTSGPLDESYAVALDEACRAFKVAALTVPLGVSRSPRCTLNHPIAIAPTPENRRRVVRRLKTLVDICERPLLLEPAPNTLAPDPAAAVDFLVEVAVATRSAVNLNLTHLVAGRLGTRDLRALVTRVPVDLIGAIRLTGAVVVDDDLIPSRWGPLPAWVLDELPLVAATHPRYVIIDASEPSAGAVARLCTTIGATLGVVAHPPGAA